MRKIKKIYISKEVEDGVFRPVTPKQLSFIEGLLLRKRTIKFDMEKDGNRLGIKQASNLIDCLIKNKPFQIIDRDKLSKRKQELLDAKYKAKIEERKKYKAIRKAPVKIDKNWNPSKPKTFDNIPKISLAEQQAKLNRLETQED